MTHFFAPLYSQTELLIQGKDALAVLNNLCTADLKKKSSGDAAEAFITEVRGRAMAHGMLYLGENHISFQGDGGQGERLRQHIDRYIIREDAQIADVSDQFQYYLLKGQAWLSYLTDHCDCPQGMIESGKPSWRPLSLQGLSGQIRWTAAFGEEAYCLILSRRKESDGAATSTVVDLLAGCPESKVASQQDLSSWRIAAFWPQWGVDIDEKNIPQEAARTAHAISFTKGCYLGQETIARLDALGQVQKKLVSVHARETNLSEIEPPIILKNKDKEVGTISSIARFPDGIFRGIAMVRRGNFEVGTELVTTDGATFVVAASPD